MKKQYSVLLLIAAFGGMQAAELAKDPRYAKIKHAVDLLRENIYAPIAKNALSGAVLGASTASGGLMLAGPEKRAKVEEWYLNREFYLPHENTDIAAYRIGIVGGALAGAVAGAGKAELQRRYTIWRINTILRTTAYDFMKLPINEAIMVYAAYKHDLPAMHTALPQVQRFLKKRNVWQALAQLYFGASTPEHVSRLKEALEIE